MQLHIYLVTYILLQPWHMSAAVLNAFHNVWLREVTGMANLSITVNNHPLPRSNEGQVGYMPEKNYDSNSASIYV